VTDGGGARTRAAGSAAVTLTELHKSFGALEVLKGVSLQALEGEVVSILGASGSGKSTLLRCINMLEVPDSGDVVVAGERVLLRKGRTAAPSRPTAPRSIGCARGSAWCSRPSISGLT
jgi:octopine/nopaline transport system ATP-binding protein